MGAEQVDEIAAAEHNAVNLAVAIDDKVIDRGGIFAICTDHLGADKFSSAEIAGHEIDRFDVRRLGLIGHFRRGFGVSRLHFGFIVAIVVHRDVVFVRAGGCTHYQGGRCCSNHEFFHDAFSLLLRENKTTGGEPLFHAAYDRAAQKGGCESDSSAADLASCARREAPAWWRRSKQERHS